MAKRNETPLLEDDPLWYKDAVIYELHVRSFCDSTADGTGDFRGLTSKLDYLQDLGVTALWLLPFYPSPLKDDGYDIADYDSVHPDYGTLKDFRLFLREAHSRGLRVITELVVNHTSDRHQWFQRARRAPAGSTWRDFYVWSDTPDRYRDARIIFKDFETSNWSWDPLAKAYYWHRFYAHQPDLNFENPAVRQAVFDAMDFWFEMGVDGLRLDAVPYLYEREETNCENLTETHSFLKELRGHVDRKFKNRMLLAEANQWPEDAAAYFGAGDECHMAFHFPLMPRLFMGTRLEDRFAVVDILQQTPQIGENCQWALFLRNHDELTLEMVTDEERDYMYRAFAHDPRMRINLGIRRRLAPLLGNSRRQIELMNGLLLSLPGTPVIYYGDEIAMGDNFYLGDRNGVRTPMQWSADRNAGFSRANPQRLFLPVVIDPEYHYEAINVEAQQNNPHSMLWWMKRLIALRRQFKAFGRGTLEFLHPENHKVLAYLRRYQDETILVVANLSRFVQAVELDLAALHGMVPVELFGRVRLPVIGDKPYFLTLGPHTFYWFALEPSQAVQATAGRPELPTISVAQRWQEVLAGRSRTALQRLLPAYIRERRWFGAKARTIKAVTVVDAIPVPLPPTDAVLALINVEYVEGDPQVYALPLTLRTGARADEVVRDLPHAAVARIETDSAEGGGILCDALVEKEFNEALLGLVAKRRRLRGTAGELSAWPTRAFRKLRAKADGPLEPTAVKGEQSNSSIVFRDRFILKLFRRVEPGVNPDLEIGQYLSEQRSFPNTPQIAGAIEYRLNGDPRTVAILHQFVANEGDAWRYTMDALGSYYEQALASARTMDKVPLPEQPALDLVDETPPAAVAELLGPYIASARTLGQRTGELHASLAAETEDPAMAPEPFSALYQRALFQSQRSLASRTFQLLGRRIGTLPEHDQELAREALRRESDVIRKFQTLTSRRISCMRIRCHGDYHLGQVLATGRDFVIIDFEGEPARSLTERRIKRSAMWDVAGMLRSFNYVAHASVREQAARGVVAADGLGTLEPWAQLWESWVSAAFLKEYLRVVGSGPLLPASERDIETLLGALLMEKAVYELGYELNNRPDWVRIPLKGMMRMLSDRAR